MKKVVRILTIWAVAMSMLVMAVTGCTSGGGAETKASESVSEQTDGSDKAETESGDISDRFSVGFARVEIMPEEPVLIGGYGTVRWSEGFYSKLYLSCIALTDAAGETALLFSWEATAARQTVVDDIFKRIEEAYGIPSTRVHITATHNHGAPDLAASTVANSRYVQQTVNHFVTLAGEALADRRPAEIQAGSIEVEGLSFVRHYISESGMARGDNYSNETIDPVPLLRHTAEPDRTFQFLRFVREGAKDVLFSAWRCHNTTLCGADYVNLTGGFTGAYIKYAEKALDCHCIYFQCDAGRINPRSRIEEKVDAFGRDEQEAFGKRLADYAIEIYDKLTPVESGNMKFLNRTFAGKINHAQDYLLTQATEIKRLWDAKSITSAEGMNMAAKINEELGLTYYEGIHSVYHANYIVTKAGSGPTRDLEISAMAIGDDIAITFDTYEMFDSTGSNIRAASPYKYTITCSYTDGALAYIPSEEAYDYGCYEADSCLFVKGTAEELEKTFLEMLHELKKQ